MARILLLLLIGLPACADTIAEQLAALASPDPGERAAAFAALAEVGPALVPRLEAARAQAEGFEQAALIDELLALYAVSGLLERLRDPDIAEYDRAREWLAEVDPDTCGVLLAAVADPDFDALARTFTAQSAAVQRAGLPLIVALIEHAGARVQSVFDGLPLDEWSGLVAATATAKERLRVAMWIGSFGAEALPAIEELLAHSEAEWRQHAVRLVEQPLWKDTAHLLPKLQALCAGDPDEQVRAAVLARLAKRSPEDVRELAYAALADRATRVRSAAVLVLFPLRPEPARFVPALLPVLDAGDEASLYAIKCLAMLGPEADAALPALVALLERGEDRRIEDACLVALGSLGPALFPEAPSRGPACALLGGWLASERRVDATLIEALEGLGPRAVAELARGLRSGSPQVVRSVLQALSGLGPDSASEQQALERVLDFHDPAVALEAAGVLLALDPAHQAAREAALEALGSPREPVRLAAARALRALPVADADTQAAVRAAVGENGALDSELVELLGVCGPDTASLRLIAACVGGSDARLAHAARGTLRALGAEVVPFLLEELETAEPKARERLLLALGACGEEAAEALPAVLAALEDPDPALRDAALIALPSLGAPAEEVVPALLAALPARFAFEGVARLGPNAEAALPALLEGWEREPERAGDYLHALGALGPAAAEALPRLRDALAAKRDLAAVLEALEGLGPAAAPALPELLPLLEADDPYFWNAADAVLAIGVADTAVVARLHDACEADGGPRMRALEVLAQLAPADPRTRDALLAALDAGTMVRNAAIAGLGPVRVEVEANVALLAELLDKGERRGDRLQALTALTSLGPEAAAALPAITNSLRYDYDVRRLAAQAAEAVQPTGRGPRLEALIERAREVSRRR